jgi:hypothetical protein
MPELESLIRALLLDTRVESFLRHAVFRGVVQRDPESAEILLPLFQRQSGTVRVRAAAMLAALDEQALIPVLRAARRANTPLRFRLLMIAEQIAYRVPDRRRAALAAQAVAHVRPLLRDRSAERRDPRFEAEIETDFEDLRVCDAALILFRGLSDAAFQMEDFLFMTHEERDEVVALGRMTSDVA